MMIQRIFLWCSFLVSLSVQAALPVAVNGQQLPSLAPMLKQVMPAVVNIATREKVKVNTRAFVNPLLNDFFHIPGYQREKVTNSLGSGVIVDADNGYILTNNHVVENAFEITVTLADGRELYAEIIGRDPDTDVAVIKIKSGGLKAIRFADSSALQVGDFVVAIGNPFGLGQTVTSGIVSAKGRSGLGIESYEDFIQTDASINPGSSGGALVNLNGELVGINTAILGSSAQSKGNIGIGFAIPINMAKDIMTQLIEYGEVKRGHLGIQAQDLSAQLARALKLKTSQKGVVITQIEKGSPADLAGLRVADVIVQANDKKIHATTDMYNLIGLLRVHQQVTLSVLRQGRPLTFKVKIEEIKLQSMDASELSPRLYGMQIAEIKKSDLQRGDVEQLLVQTVKTGSPAWRLGFREGDIIEAVNRRVIKSIKQLKQLENSRQPIVLFQLRRDNQSLLLVIR